MVIKTVYKGDMIFETETNGIKLIMTPRHPDKGLSPPVHVLAALSSCIGVYVANYCENAEIDTTGMEISLDFSHDEEGFHDFKADVKMPNADFKGRETAIKKVAEHCTVDEMMKAFSGCEISIGN